MCYDRARAYDTSSSQAHPGQEDHASANPDIILDHDLLRWIKPLLEHRHIKPPMGMVSTNGKNVGAHHHVPADGDPLHPRIEAQSRTVSDAHLATAAKSCPSFHVDILSAVSEQALA
jgi:hypothetical protein